jgi:hypothetical protein
MLASMMIRVGPKESALAIRRRPRQRIEFMVAHDRHRGAGFAHSARNTQDLPLIGPTVDEVTYENCLPLGVSKDTTDFGVFHFRQQSAKSVCVPVNITNDVVALL